MFREGGSDKRRKWLGKQEVQSADQKEKPTSVLSQLGKNIGFRKQPGGDGRRIERLNKHRMIYCSCILQVARTFSSERRVEKGEVRP